MSSTLASRRSLEFGKDPRNHGGAYPLVGAPAMERAAYQLGKPTTRVPGLGAGNTPAMFSAPVINRLRTQLGFQGVIVSDSLSMGGIGARYSLPQAAVLALAAGNDLILLGNGALHEGKAMSAIQAAVKSGRIDRNKLHESALRVNQLRDKWGLAPTPCPQMPM